MIKLYIFALQWGLRRHKYEWKDYRNRLSCSYDYVSLRGRRLKGMGKRVLGALIPFPSLSNACHAGYDYVDVRRALQNKHLTARTLNFSLLQLRVSSFVLLLMACVKTKILVLVLASSCEKESGFQRKEREKENLIFGNLPVERKVFSEVADRSDRLGWAGWTQAQMHRTRLCKPELWTRKLR